MKKVWVVVANQTKASIYQAKNVHTLEEIHGFCHPQGHLHDQDLVGDRQGRSTKAFGHGTNTYQEKTQPHQKESHLFAMMISQYLEKHLLEKSFEKLYIIASPTFLGFLRECFSHLVKKAINSEIPKDVVGFDTEQIRGYLPPVL